MLLLVLHLKRKFTFLLLILCWLSKLTVLIHSELLLLDCLIPIVMFTFCPFILQVFTINHRMESSYDKHKFYLISVNKNHVSPNVLVLRVCGSNCNSRNVYHLHPCFIEYDYTIYASQGMHGFAVFQLSS